MLSLAWIAQVRDVWVLDRNTRAATCCWLPLVAVRVRAVGELFAPHRPGADQTVDRVPHAARQMPSQNAVPRHERGVRSRRQAARGERALRRRRGGATGTGGALQAGVGVGAVRAGAAARRPGLVLVRADLIDGIADVSTADGTAVIKTTTTTTSHGQ